MLREIIKMPLVIPENHCLFGGEAECSTFRFLQDVAMFRGCLKRAIPCGKTVKVLLYDSDTYSFLVHLMALGAEKHTIVLPPNDQLGTITDLVNSVDYTAGTVAVENKEHLTVDKSENDFCKDDFYWPDKGELIFYTSGSSGDAKAIKKNWLLLNNELDVLGRLFKYHPKTSFFSTVSHQHIYGLLFRALLPLRLGHSIFNTFEYPEHIIRKIKSDEKVVLITSPAFLSRLVKDNVLSELKAHFSYIFSSGGPLQDSDSYLLNEQFGQGIVQVYGSTETGGIAYRQLGVSRGDLWTFFPGVECKIGNEDNRLVLSSPFIGQANMLLDDQGDVIDGKLKLLGRVDRMVKLEEKRINLTQVEVKCCQHRWVSNARLVVLSGKRKELAAVIALNDEGNAALDKLGKRMLNQALKEHLLAYFELVTLPRKWRYVKLLPYNSQGKLPAVELEKLFV